MLNAVGQAQHILLLGGTSEIGLGVVSEFLQRGPAKVTLAARPESPRIAQARFAPRCPPRLATPR